MPPLADNLKPDSETNPPSEIPPSKPTIESIKDLLFSQEFKDYILKGREIKRPKHVSKLSNFSYYREQFALEIKVILDQMIEDKKDRIWRYSAYPELRPSSLYQRVNQSLNYLLRELDFDGRYARLREMLIIDRKSNKSGIILAFIRDKLEGRGFVPDVVGPREKTHQYKEEIEKFLTDPTQKELHIKNLALSTQEMEDLYASINDLENILPLITEREIKIVKVESEEK